MSTLSKEIISLIIHEEKKKRNLEKQEDFIENVLYDYVPPEDEECLKKEEEKESPRGVIVIEI